MGGVLALSAHLAAPDEAWQRVRVRLQHRRQDLYDAWSERVGHRAADEPRHPRQERRSCRRTRNRCLFWLLRGPRPAVSGSRQGTREGL